MTQHGRPRRHNPKLLRNEEIKLHVNILEKQMIEDHFGKGRVSRRIREIIIQHCYECDKEGFCK